METEILIRFIQTQSLQDVDKMSDTIETLRKEKLVSRAFLDQNQGDIDFFKDFLSGFHKYTFLIQGDPQVGKTTLSNCLADDDLFLNVKKNGINIFQYDANCEEPELFTAQLQSIFNLDKQVFSIRPDQLKKTGMKGRGQIQNFLKQQSDEEIQNEDNQNVFIVRYRIRWLEDLIADKSILDRIQFADYHLSAEKDLQYDFIRILQKIETSKYSFVLFIADGQKLFTQNIAQKFKESQNEKTMVIINRTDTLGTTEHFSRIDKRLPILSDKIGKNIAEIEEIIENSDETHQMKNEILYQSFLEAQNILEKNSVKPLYFISGLSQINRILLINFQKSLDDEAQATLNDLFVKRNKANRILQGIKRESEKLKIPAIQGFLKKKDQADEFLNDNSLIPIQKELAKTASSELLSYATDVFNGIKEQKVHLSYCESYSPNKLSEAEIDELSDLFEHKIFPLFSDSQNSLKESVHSLRKSCKAHLKDFVKKVKGIHSDYYHVKANHKDQLKSEFQVFKGEWEKEIRGFKVDLEAKETAREKAIDRLLAENKTKKHLHLYIVDNIYPANQQIKEEALYFIQTISAIAAQVKNSLEYFVDDKEGEKVGSKFVQFFAHLFSRNCQIEIFDDQISHSKSFLKKNMENMNQGFQYSYAKTMKKIRENYEDYKKNAPGFSVERVREIIKTTLSS